MRFDLSVPSQLVAALTPDIVMMVGATILMVWSAWGAEDDNRQRTIGFASIGVCLVAAAAVIYYMIQGATAGPGLIAVDNFRWIANLIFLVGTIGTLLLAIENNTREGITAGEMHVLLLFATSGMMILAAARDLIIVFLGIELMSIAVYIMVGMNRRSERSAEGALKYFLLGAFSTAFLLYGMALVYGATGTLNLAGIASRINELSLQSHPMLLAGIGLMLIGFGFKIAAVPFHMWAPDVYEGAPTPITAYMAAAVKGAAFAVMLRIWFEGFAPAFHNWHGPVWWLAAATMLVGNLVALAQKNIKRMLAYSSIAHAGYLLVALTVGESLGSTAFLFYIFAYTLATFGAFAVVSAVSYPGGRNTEINDYAGLWSIRPGMAIAMAIFMLALLGFPVFGGIGFFAKWYVIKAALEANAPQTRLAVTLVLTSVISAGYYLYVIMVMFMRNRAEDAPDVLPTGGLTRWVVAVSAILIVGLGLYPNGLDRLMRLPTAALQTVPSTAPPSAGPAFAVPAMASQP